MFWSDKGKSRKGELEEASKKSISKVRICFLLNNEKCIQVLLVLRYSPVDYKVLDI